MPFFTRVDRRYDRLLNLSVMYVVEAIAVVIGLPQEVVLQRYAYKQPSALTKRRIIRRYALGDKTLLDVVCTFHHENRHLTDYARDLSTLVNVVK